MPLILVSTDWTSVGYPDLDIPATVGYNSDNPKDVFGLLLLKYSEIPEELNIGDIIRLELSCLPINLNGQWMLAGVVSPEGNYVKIKEEYAYLKKFPDNLRYNTLGQVEYVLASVSEKAGAMRTVASTEKVLNKYKQLLAERGVEMPRVLSAAENVRSMNTILGHQWAVRRACEAQRRKQAHKEKHEPKKQDEPKKHEPKKQARSEENPNKKRPREDEMPKRHKSF